MPQFNIFSSKNLSLEIFLVTYGLACVVINTGYEGNLKSHLSAAVLPPPINTLEEFAIKGVFEEIYYFASDVEVMEGMFRTTQALKNVPDKHPIQYAPLPLMEYVRLPLDGHAIIGAKSALQLAIIQQLTNKFGVTKVQVVEQMFTLSPTGFKQTRMNRFNKHVNKRIGQWFEAGLFAIQWKW